MGAWKEGDNSNENLEIFSAFEEGENNQENENFDFFSFFFSKTQTARRSLKQKVYNGHVLKINSKNERYKNR